MKDQVYIIGGPGGGMIAASIVQEDLTMDVAGFLNDYVPVGEKIGKYMQYPVVGTTDDLHGGLRILKMLNSKIFIAYKTMRKEEEMLEKLDRLSIPPHKLISLIHPTAVIPNGFCRIGHGVMFAANTQLSSDTTIGDNCILFGSAFVGHDSVLERYVTVANNVSIGARVHIGAASHIGSNSSIKEGVKIGKYSLVGIGSVVTKDVPENAIVVGNPAKVIRIKA
jgi:acetyltransferase EpsM